MSGNVGRRNRRIEIAREQDWCCWWCGSMMLVGGDPLHKLAVTTEHLIPRSKGGGNDRDNLVAAHRRCNESRGDELMTVEHPSMHATIRWIALRGYIGRLRHVVVVGTAAADRTPWKVKLAMAQQSGLLGPVRNDPRDMV